MMIIHRIKLMVAICALAGAGCMAEDPEGLPDDEPLPGEEGDLGATQEAATSGGTTDGPFLLYLYANPDYTGATYSLSVTPSTTVATRTITSTTLGSYGLLRGVSAVLLRCRTRPASVVLRGAYPSDYAYPVLRCARNQTVWVSLPDGTCNASPAGSCTSIRPFDNQTYSVSVVVGSPDAVDFSLSDVVRARFESAMASTMASNVTMDGPATLLYTGTGLGTGSLRLHQDLWINPLWFSPYRAEFTFLFSQVTGTDGRPQFYVNVPLSLVWVEEGTTSDLMGALEATADKLESALNTFGDAFPVAPRYWTTPTGPDTTGFLITLGSI